MKKYFLYKIDKNGALKLLMTYHALSIKNFWLSARCWVASGLYLITSDAGTAKIYRIKRT